jgi:hypothetical protein
VLEGVETFASRICPFDQYVMRNQDVDDFLGVWFLGDLALIDELLLDHSDQRPQFGLADGDVLLAGQVLTNCTKVSAMAVLELFPKRDRTRA